MAEQDNNLFAIEVNADDCAETAESDTHAVSRTYQSEDAFQAIKDTYAAKTDIGNAHQELIAAVPVLGLHPPGERCQDRGVGKVKLGKKDIQLLGYAVGQLYYRKDHEGMIDLCERVQQRCEIDTKTAGSLERWIGRCKARMSD